MMNFTDVPQADDVLPFRIGIAPAESKRYYLDGQEITQEEHEALTTGREVIQVRPLEIEAAPAETIIRLGGGYGPPPGPTKLILPGSPNGPDGPTDLVDAGGSPLSSLNWPEYLAWRRTKCKPRSSDRDAITNLYGYIEGTDAYREAWPKQEWLEEIDQATHEFIGEVAELAELFSACGPMVFYGDKRDKLIDEAGDIFFCGAWALDAWGINPFEGVYDDLELIRVTDEDPMAQMAHVLATIPAEQVVRNGKFLTALRGSVYEWMLAALTFAGLTANSFKKLKFQRKHQSAEEQVRRIIGCLYSINSLLVVANSSVEEALLFNQRKLNARFPDGYKPGVGEGIRTGIGGGA